MDATTPLGRQLREHRQQVGMTQAQFSAVIGLERSYLARLESGGVAALREERMARVADVLGMQLVELRRLMSQSQPEYRLPCAGVTQQHRLVGGLLEERWSAGALAPATLALLETIARDAPTATLEPEPTEFGALLRERRLARGLSQQALACAIGVARSYISMVESGAELFLPIASLLALGQLLDMSHEVLEHHAAVPSAHVLRARGQSDIARAAAATLQDRWMTMGPDSISRVAIAISDA